MRMDGVDDMARARARIKHPRIRAAKVEALSVEWVVKGYTRGTRHGAVYLGDAGLAQAHGSGEQGGKKLYYTPCLCAPGWTAGQSRRWRKRSEASRWWSGHASEHTTTEASGAGARRGAQ